MYSKLITVGRLGRDPEMRYSPQGTAITRFSMASSRRWTDSQGQPKEETTWMRISTFGKLAENCNAYCKKGMLVLVEGALIPDDKTGGPRVFTRKDGTTGASFEIRADTVRFLSPKSDENGREPVTAVVSDDDLPF